MKSNKDKQILLGLLKQTPIVEIAVQKANISRATFYRWKKEDKEFAKLAEEALIEGENLITDMSESQLISLIKDKNFQAVQLWLKAHHPKYNNKIEVTGNLNVKEEPLTMEQQQLVEKSLAMAGILLNNKDQQKYDTRITKPASGDNP